jgi:CRP/FNR family cyclic AMP-dependent transcriptional regulator
MAYARERITMFFQVSSNGRWAGWPNDSFVGLLGPRERERLFQQGRRREHPGGSYLIRQGLSGQDVHVVLTGQVRIMVAGLRRHQHQIASLRRGDLAGEISFLDTRPRSASAVAAGQVVSWHMSAEAFDRYLQNNPFAYRALARLLTGRLRDSEQRFVSASVDVDERVAIALCNSAGAVSPVGDREVRIGRTQAQIAREVGASTASVHRALRKFAALGILETQHRVIVVKNLNALAQIAQP